MSKRKQLASAVKPKGGAKFAKKGAVKEQEESPAPSGSEEGSETEESEADVEDDSEPQEQNDGLADMMSKILNQNIGSKVPVLAKRKTALMKDIETVHKDTIDMKKLRQERRIERAKQMVVPDASTADFERQLKKLATRGVVALFNAIAKAKRDTVATEEAATKKEPVKDDTENTSVLSREKGHQASKQKAAKQSADAQEGAAAGGEKGAKWAALRDDYMIGSNLTVKNWDKAADESDSE